MTIVIIIILIFKIFMMIETGVFSSQNFCIFYGGVSYFEENNMPASIL